MAHNARELFGRSHSLDDDGRRCNQLPVHSCADAHFVCRHSIYRQWRADLSIVVDGGTASTVKLRVPGEDVLIRWPVGEYGTGTHTVTLTHAGPAGGDFYFDFLETAVPATTLPTFPDEPRMTLATDWDTDHSIALAPERTAWLIDTLGFKGRQNHYVGALWFYELANPDNVYAAGTVTFGGTPEPGQFVSIFLARDDDPEVQSPTEIQRGMHGGDTLETIAISYAQELNHGYTGVWASVSGSVVTIYARSMGDDGNHYTLGQSTTSSTLTVSVSATFSGGHTGVWRTDLTATPRLNRAVRDWNRSFFTALASYGIDVVTAFSTELRDVDPAVERRHGPARSGRRRDSVADAFVPNELFADESRFLEASVSGCSGDSGGCGLAAVSAVRRRTVVVFSE